MRRWSTYSVGVAVMAGWLLAAPPAGAETATLELKRVTTLERPDSEEMPLEHLFRMTRPQTVFGPLGGPEGIIRRFGQDDAPSFSDVIKKEPAEYASKTPFRGVVQLGSHNYGFVLDVAAPEEEKEEKEEPAEKKERERGGLFSALGRALTAPLTKKPERDGRAPVFTRLYFDLNRNGDLTDDGVIEAGRSQAPSMSHSRSVFPVVELTIDVDGKPLEYAFVLSVSANVSEHFSYAQASFSAAAYRDGHISLDGEKRRVVLVDFNSNGRFDDVFRVGTSSDPDDDRVYPVVGDMLYIDPQPTAGHFGPYSPTTRPDQYQVTNLIAYDGRFFDLKIGDGGETLSLTPSPAPVGFAANPNSGARVIVHGEHGMLEVAFDEQGRTTLPEGTWKMLSYTIVQPAEPEAEPEDAEANRQRLRAAVPPTMVSARAKAKARAARIAGGKTTNMTFGPPFTPRVTASPSYRDPGTISLDMSLVGAGGEVCTSMIINGRRPPPPEFTIYTKDGKEVASGKFSYG